MVVVLCQIIFGLVLRLISNKKSVDYEIKITFSQIDLLVHEISKSLLSILEPQATFAADLDTRSYFGFREKSL